MKPSRIQTASGTLNRQCASATADVRVEQADRRVELEERQREDRRRRHAVGQQPEEQMLVAEEPVAREGVGRRQRDAQTEITVLITT